MTLKLLHMPASLIHLESMFPWVFIPSNDGGDLEWRYGCSACFQLDMNLWAGEIKFWHQGCVRVWQRRKPNKRKESMVAMEEGREKMTLESVSHTMTRLIVGLGLVLVVGGAWALLQEVLATVLR